MSHLDCQYIYNSSQSPQIPPAVGFITDLARDPSAAHQLIKLGISPRKDLPALLLTDAGGKLRLVGLRMDREEAYRLLDGQLPAPRKIVLYSATWCPDCQRVKRFMEGAGVTYLEVDLDTNDKAEALILERSGGRRVVPSLVLDDRMYLFNPDLSLLQSQLLPSQAGTNQGGAATHGRAASDRAASS